MIRSKITRLFAPYTYTWTLLHMYIPIGNQPSSGAFLVRVTKLDEIFIPARILVY